jgi:hypothetical protein
MSLERRPDGQECGNPDVSCQVGTHIPEKSVLLWLTDVKAMRTYGQTFNPCGAADGLGDVTEYAPWS